MPAGGRALTGPDHLFRVDGDLLIPSDLVRGPWDHGLQHGGAVCGALGWAVSAAHRAEGGDDADRFQLCRLTTELLRPVPAVALRYTTSIDRAGRHGRVVSAALWDGERRVAQASSQWARTRGGPAGQAVRPSSQDPAVPLRPAVATDPGASELGYPRPGFNCDVFELRCLRGTTEDPGPGTIWARMRVGLVEGVPLDAIQRLATVSDLGNAVGWERSLAGEPMVNPDVTLQLLRYPVGEWVCLDARSTSTSAGIGLMETVLWDGEGRFGRVLSTTMESPMDLQADLPGGPGGPDRG